MKFWLSSIDSSPNLRKLPALQKKKVLSKLENIGVRDYRVHISTSEIENLKITDEVNIFCNKP